MSFIPLNWSLHLGVKLDFSPSLRIKKGWKATLVQIIFCLAVRPTPIFSCYLNPGGGGPLLPRGNEWQVGCAVPVTWLYHGDDHCFHPRNPVVWCCFGTSHCLAWLHQDDKVSDMDSIARYTIWIYFDDHCSLGYSKNCQGWSVVALLLAGRRIAPNLAPWMQHQIPWKKVGFESWAVSLAQNYWPNMKIQDDFRN